MRYSWDTTAHAQITGICHGAVQWATSPPITIRCLQRSKGIERQFRNVTEPPGDGLKTENNIRYEFLVQDAGDLVWIRYGILHQVVQSLQRYVRAAHATSEGSGMNSGSSMCSVCSKVVKDIVRHEKQRRQKLVVC